MLIDTLPVAIPDDLAHWRPSCDIFASHDSECGNAADYALVTHGGCQVKLTCAPCYDRFLTIFHEWLRDMPKGNIVVCIGCGGHLENASDALHLEKL